MRGLTTSIVQTIVGSEEDVLVTRRPRSVERAARRHCWSLVIAIEARAEPCNSSIDHGDGLFVILADGLVVDQDAASVDMLREIVSGDRR